MGMMMLELFRDGVAEPFKFGVKAPWRNHWNRQGSDACNHRRGPGTGVHTLVLTSHHSLAALHVC